MMIPNNAETEWEVNWSRLYGELPAGSYRISKSVMDSGVPVIMTPKPIMQL